MKITLLILTAFVFIVAPQKECVATEAGYSTSIGIRGGYTSGVTLKQFLSSTSAVEVIAGSRWNGLSVAGIYEIHKGNAFDVSSLTWVYGLGGRLGYYDGRSYYRFTRGQCNDPENPRCYVYWEDRSIVAIGVIGIGGIEYKFDEIPFTISLDLMPLIYLNHYRGNYFDASMAIRYIIK